MIEESNNQTYRALAPGTELCGGKYVIDKKIGEGGFGITYRALHSSLNRTVCIKEYFLSGKCARATHARTVCVQESSENFFEKYRQSFVKEAKMLATLNHPNIVEVIDVFDENNTSYMVMSFIEGKSVLDIVNSRGRLPYPEVVNYIAQIANAVGYIHDRHILHRDIKPDNIMITADYKAILIDFGSARDFEQDKTQVHTSILTPGYAPPEQYSTKSKKGSYSDIYALGATMYFMLTGQPPLESAARLNEQIAAPKEIVPEIPDEANRTILKAMQLKAENRHQTIQDFMDDLRNIRPSELVDETIGQSGGKHHPSQDGVSNSIYMPLPDKPHKRNLGLWALFTGLVLVSIIIALFLSRQDGIVVNDGNDENTLLAQVDSTLIESDDSSADTLESSIEAPRPGSVKISSSPSEATIWLDGNNTRRKTPDILDDLSPGKHRIKLVLEGYNDYTCSVTIISGERVTISHELSIKREPVMDNVITDMHVEEEKVKEKNGIENGHLWVDLGLSVKWASTNVGAVFPYEYGKYYACGEVSTKTEYTWSNLRYCLDDDGNRFSKYNTSASFGVVDGKTSLELSDDVARVNWGGQWRMPTHAEFRELLYYCDRTWTAKGGVKGYLLTSMKNGETLFLPAAGYREGTATNGLGSAGYYLCATLHEDRPYYAYHCGFDASELYTGDVFRYYGLPVRPVME